jgi:hypothetical protein
MSSLAIRPAVIFSFITLFATNLDGVSRITPNTCLSSRAQSLAFTVSSFSPKRGKYIVSSYTDNLQSASSTTQNLCH